jgi:hypothetical protein
MTYSYFSAVEVERVSGPSQGTEPCRHRHLQLQLPVRVLLYVQVGQKLRMLFCFFLQLFGRLDRKLQSYKNNSNNIIVIIQVLLVKVKERVQEMCNGRIEDEEQV